jgi:hypothetical protein
VSGAVSEYQADRAAIACLCPSIKVSRGELASAAAALKQNGARHIYSVGQAATPQDTAGAQTFIDESSDALATLSAAYDILQQQNDL